MTNDTNLNQLVINKLTKAQYQEAKEAGSIVETEIYMITDADEVINADTLGGLPADDYATQAFVANKIAEAQLGGGGDIDLSGYATKDDLNNIDFPVDSINGKTGAVTLSASDIGARPDTWTPTAADVGAAPSSHNHSASDINSGKLSLAYGGTGQSLSNIPKGAVVRNSTDGTGLWYAAAKSGALYATAAETAPKFGTLPIAQGGTGATTAANAVSGLGIKDYVVAQGTSGIWTYRKWNSGIAECWGQEMLSNFTTADRTYHDNIYRSEEFANIIFPFNFTEIPVWNVTVTDLSTSAGSGYFGGVIYLYGAFVNSTGKYAVYSEAPLSFTSASAKHYVIGRWK